MCVACLNVSMQPCCHHWYELVRPCDPAHNLANCPSKLKLQGWENRVETCPFCDGGQHHCSTHRLVGGAPLATSCVATSSAVGVFGSLPGAPAQRSRQSSLCSSDDELGGRSQRARDMNDRIFTYLASEPHEVLPSARKNYPTYSAAISRMETTSSTNSAPDQDRSGIISSRRASLRGGWRRMSAKINTTGLFRGISS